MDNETYIRLTAPITQHSAEKLLQIVDQKYRSGVRKLHLLLSTPGGNVAHGINIYNFLKGVPIEIVTHNFGTVDSIGIILFCAGSQRYSVPHARFFLHPVAMKVNQNTKLDENSLLEYQNGLKIDQTNIARVIAFTTNNDESLILQDIHSRKTLSPDEAVKYGLVTDIETNLMPMNSDFVPIYESEASQLVKLNIPTPQSEFVGIPPHNSFSDIYDFNGVSTYKY